MLVAILGTRHWSGEAKKDMLVQNACVQFCAGCGLDILGAAPPILVGSHLTTHPALSSHCLRMVETKK